MSRTDSVLKHLCPSKNLKSRYVDSDKTKALCEKYYDEDQLQCRYFLLRGKLYGKAQVWYRNGQISCEEYYKRGFLHGIKRKWYSTGVLMSETTYKNGVKHGARKVWHENQVLQFQCIYNLGKLNGERAIRSSMGHIIWEEKYQDDLRHGIFKQWNRYGKLVFKKMYIWGTEFGRSISEFLNRDKLNAQAIVGVENIEARRMLLEELGYERFLMQMEYEVLDNEEDYELVKIDWHEHEEHMCLVKVKCPSTGVFYVLRVPPEMKTCREAIAWTFGLTADEYLPEYET